ncbi:MAG: pyridoxamine 5'-phosphate oxidase family protein, partial [Chthoniobacterales bacterium]
IERVSDSCGLSVPFYDFTGPRDQLDRWAEKQGPEKLDDYRAAKNQRSIDNLPAFTNDAS